MYSQTSNSRQVTTLIRIPYAASIQLVLQPLLLRMPSQQKITKQWEIQNPYTLDKKYSLNILDINAKN